MRITSVSIPQSTLTSDAPPLWNLRHTSSGSEAFSFEQLQMEQSWWTDSYTVRISAIKTVSGVAPIVFAEDLRLFRFFLFLFLFLLT